MKYHELFSEYASLLREKKDCQNVITSLKNGYISTKTISGKKYTYLQHRVGGKLSSEYIREDCLPKVRDELDKRTIMLKKIKAIDERIEKIETAVAILDSNLCRKLIILRRCAVMDSMPFDEREKSLVFGSAMTALEGISAHEEIEKNLARWANGDFSFQESYLNTLRIHHLTEV